MGCRSAPSIEAAAQGGAGRGRALRRPAGSDPGPGGRGDVPARQGEFDRGLQARVGHGGVDALGEFTQGRDVHAGGRCWVFTIVSCEAALRRIDKDKSIVKKLEKTRREAHPDLQQERAPVREGRDPVAEEPGQSESRLEERAGEGRARRRAARDRGAPRGARRVFGGRERAAAAAGPVPGRRARGRAARRAVPGKGGAAARRRRHVWVGCGPVAAGG